MSEQAGGWGAQAFPPRAQRLLAQEAAAEAREVKRAEEERQATAEARRAQALELYGQQAALRGEDVSAFALATGQITGRSITDILTAARSAGDREDAVGAARASREADGARAHVFVGEPVLHHGRGEAGWAIFHRARRFRAEVRARKALEAAENAAMYDRAQPRAALVRDEGGGVVHTGPERRPAEDLRRAWLQ